MLYLYIYMSVCAWLFVYVYLNAFVHFCRQPLSETKLYILYSKVQNALQRGVDYAFVSRSYTDICSCNTNVTSHNPEKLHQSHLITHIHDAVFA